LRTGVGDGLVAHVQVLGDDAVKGLSNPLSPTSWLFGFSQKRSVAGDRGRA
jgi:hypothetical protein